MKRSIEQEQDFFTPSIDNGPSDDGIVRSTRECRPAHFLLKIEAYSFLCKTGVETYESGIFEAGGHKWNLSFYPMGNCKDKGYGHISLYLKLAETESLPHGWEVNAMFKFFVFDQLRKKYLTIQEGDETIRHFNETNTEWGLARLLSLETFNDISKGYLIDDCCILGAEVFVIKKSGRMESLYFVRRPFNNIYSWKLEKFSALDKEFYFSEGFTVQGTVWKLLVYPKGRSVSKGEGLAVYLHYNGNECFYSNQKVYAEFKLRVKNQLGDKHKLHNKHEHSKKRKQKHGNQCNQEYTAKHWFCASSSNYGCCQLISLKDLEETSKGYLLEDCLIIEGEIVSMSRVKSCSFVVGSPES